MTSFLSNKTDVMGYTHQENETVMIPINVSVAGASIGILITLLGMFGNILLVLSVFSNKLKASNIFVVSMAFWDLFQTIGIKPLYIYTYMVRKWNFGADICVYALYASNIAILESILHICAIAFYRYLSIVHPKLYRNLPKRLPMLVILFIIYTLPMLIILIPAHRRFVAPQLLDVTVAFHPKIMFCSLVRDHNAPHNKTSGIVKKVIFLAAAALFLLYCYVRICILVRESGKNIAAKGGCGQPKQVIRRETTLFKTVVIIFLSFAICYLPISIIYYFDSDESLSYWVYLIGVILLWISSSVNWIIYGVVNTQYRYTYRYLIWERRRPTPATGVSDNNNSSRISRNHNTSIDNKRQRPSSQQMLVDVTQFQKETKYKRAVTTV